MGGKRREVDGREGEGREGKGKDEGMREEKSSKGGGGEVKKSATMIWNSDWTLNCVTLY